MLRCKSCLATYDPLQADGTTYFHACPPLSAAELAAKVVAGKIVLPIDPDTLVAETAEKAVQRRVYERANKRDENLPGTKASDAGQVKAAGDGTTDLGPKPPAVVIVPK